MISRKTTSLSLDHTPAQKPCEPGPQTSPLDSILLKGLAKLKSWKLPPHWSAQGWFDEVRQLAWEAACEALCDYKVGATTPIGAFVYLRIMQRVLTGYRREWSYAQRFVPEPINATEWRQPLPEGEGWGEGELRIGQSAACALEDPCEEQHRVQQHESMREAVAILPASQRSLIDEIFWNGRTEQELGKMLHVSQRTVNKRKQAALQLLRDQINGSKSG